MDWHPVHSFTEQIADTSDAMASIYSETDGSNGAMPAVDSIMTLSPEEYAQAALDKLFGTGLSGQVSSI